MHILFAGFQVILDSIPWSLDESLRVSDGTCRPSLCMRALPWRALLASSVQMYDFLLSTFVVDKNNLELDSMLHNLVQRLTKLSADYVPNLSISTQIDFKQVASLDLPPMTTISSVLCSNYIFIFANEEFILALSFEGFIIFSQKTFSETLNTTSDLQSEACLFELQQF